jgi:cell division protein ZapA (FtsZ GTPase activity inhibitor)
MDSTQKILKELSDLTRNLDVLAKEIRETNKISSQNQKTAIKTIETMENTAKKTEEVSSRVEKPSKQETGKNEPVKEISNSGKNPDGLFSNFLKSIRDTIKKESPELKKPSLADLSQSTVLKDKKEGTNLSYPEISNSIKKVGDTRKMATASIKKELNTLKNKERRTKEEDEQLKKTEDYLKIKEDKETTKSIISSVNKPEVVTRKDENKGFFEKLLEKISPNKEGGKETTVITGSSTKTTLKTETSKEKEAKKDGNKGFFDRLVEKIRPEKKEDNRSDKTLDEKSTEKKSSVDAITKSPVLSEGQKIKEDFKDLYKESRLGKSISGVKSLFTKGKKSEDSIGKTEMKREGQTLKISTNKEPITSTSQEKEKKEENRITPISIESPSTPSAKSTTTPTPSIEAKKSTEGENVTLTSDDIKEIKSLLSSINTSLRGPLNIKDNKPFRPKSNMLE